MTIRRRIMSTYLVLMAIVLLYLAVSSFGQNIRVSVDQDMNAILELKNSWSEMQVALNDLLVHWDDGSAYRRLLDRRREFGVRLTDARETVNSRAFYPREFRQYFENLGAVWTLAEARLTNIDAVVERPEFAAVEERVRRQTGLQRFSLAWQELIEINTLASRRQAHTIRQLMGEVEFFPIYRDTVDHMFTVILSSAVQIQDRVVLTNRITWFVFFTAFIAACVVIALHFSHTLSRPIIRIAQRLRDFTGQTGAENLDHEHDEVRVLFRTVDHMIEHYTNLSERAEKLSRGEIDRAGTTSPREGIVGRSIEEIASYLRELAQTSGWIRDGEYGSRIRERSEHDVIAHTFNVMSGVIHEKITTLRNMYEAMEEAVLVLGENGEVLETNSRFTELFGYDASLPELTRDRDELHHQVCMSVVRQLAPFTKESFQGGTVTDHYLNLQGVHNREIPVRISSRVLPDKNDEKRQVMFLISNESWRARAKRERERLRAQATVAELKALRAQINPHFFFNTLNTIAHLIETDAPIAVETVEKLSGLFRYTLAATTRDRVRLEEELEHVRHLLDIERLRYGERLNVEFLIDQDLRGHTLPPMLLQPLVENAVRYGGDDTGHVRLHVTARRDGHTVKVEIADQGGSEIDFDRLLKTSGTGIRNVNHRLKTLYGRPLVFRRNTPQGLVVEVNLPT